MSFENIESSDSLPDSLLIIDLQAYPSANNDQKMDGNQKILALGFLKAKILEDAGGEKIIVEECRTGGKINSLENELLAGFWKSFDLWKPRLVSFGGRSFVLPLLKVRSMKWGLTAQYLHTAGDRWSGYHIRQDLNYHVDLQDCLSDFGALPLLKLQEISESIGLPFQENSMNAVEDEGLLVKQARENAEANVITILQIYLRWKLFIGHMSFSNYEKSMVSLKEQVTESQKLCAKARERIIL